MRKGKIGKEFINVGKEFTGKEFVNAGKESSLPGKLSCGVPQGSILGPLIFLLYVNDMPQAVDCGLLLYAGDSCLVFSDNSVNDIEEQLNKNFNSLCD